ncbi:hypothetical protein BT69DRAFT_1351237 [Atractiella rhizophila]|nr:hypothetical protein BT69DRAFT_1351237 [Atractiella rhizophila]
MLLQLLLLLPFSLAFHLQNAKITLSDGVSSRDYTLPSGTVPTLELSRTSTLSFSGTVDNTPHQAMLIFHDAHSRSDYSTLLKVRKGGKIRYHLDLSKPPSALLSRFPSGRCSLSLVLGSFSSSEASSTTLAELKIDDHLLSSALAGAKDSTPTEWEVEKYAALPELSWTFREPEKSVWTITALFWSLVVLSPWAVFAALTSNINLVKRKAITPKTTAFLLSLFSVDASIFIYWTSLNLFQAAPLFAVTSILTLFTGKNALSEIKRQREGSH